MQLSSDHFIQLGLPHVVGDESDQTTGTETRTVTVTQAQCYEDVDTPDNPASLHEHDYCNIKDREENNYGKNHN